MQHHAAAVIDRRARFIAVGAARQIADINRNQRDDARRKKGQQSFNKNQGEADVLACQ